MGPVSEVASVPVAEVAQALPPGVELLLSLGLRAPLALPLLPLLFLHLFVPFPPGVPLDKDSCLPRVLRFHRSEASL